MTMTSCGSAAEQAVAKVFRLCPVDRQQTQAGVQLAARVALALGLGEGVMQGLIQPAPIRVHFADDSGHVFGGGLEKASLQSLGSLSAVAFPSHQLIKRPIPRARSRPHAACCARPAAS